MISTKNTTILFLGGLFGAVAACSAQTHSRSQTIDDNNTNFLSENSDPEFMNRTLRAFGPGPAPNELALERLRLDWPLDAVQPTVLARFDTPVTIRLATIKGVSQFLTFLHSAIDIVRNDRVDSDRVRAPVSGILAVISEQEDENDFSEPYSMSVAIKDDESGFIVSLLHVQADAQFLLPPVGLQQFRRVQRGDAIGTLARVQSIIDTNREPDFRHTHLSVFDPNEKVEIDPSPFLPFYRDSISPEIKSVYLLDGESKLVEQIEMGKRYDIVVEAFDRDDFSALNLEIGGIEASLEGENGETFFELKPCSLRHYQNESIAKNFTSLFDIKSSESQIQSGLFDSDNDAANKDRTFRYAITNIKNSKHSTGQNSLKDGTACLVVDDEVGFVEFKQNSNVSKVFLTVYVQDLFQNRSEAFRKEILVRQ